MRQTDTIFGYIEGIFHIIHLKFLKIKKKIRILAIWTPSTKNWPKSLDPGLMYDMFTNNKSWKHCYFNLSTINQ